MIRDSKILVQYKCDLKYIQIVLIFHVFTTVGRVLNFTENSTYVDIVFEMYELLFNNCI